MGGSREGAFPVDRVLRPGLSWLMEGMPHRSMSLLTAFASAMATAFALDYMAHAEWGLSPVVIRRDALVVAGVLAVATIIKALIERKRNRDV